MEAAPIFLVIDDHAESRYLLVKTLLRKFPGAVFHELDDANKALELARSNRVTAIVTHRTAEVMGIELVRLLREANNRVPIIMVSGIDREREALEAGANCFLHYDEWLRIGSVVDAYISSQDDRRLRPGQMGIEYFARQ